MSFHKVKDASQDENLKVKKNLARILNSARNLDFLIYNPEIGPKPENSALCRTLVPTQKNTLGKSNDFVVQIFRSKDKIKILRKLSLFQLVSLFTSSSIRIGFLVNNLFIILTQKIFIVFVVDFHSNFENDFSDLQLCHKKRKYCLYKEQFVS